MKKDQALLAMTLIARRASNWAHDIVCTHTIDGGMVRDDAVRRFKADIMEALSILDRPES